MNENIFAETDAAIAKANGSKDPEAVASCHRSKIFIASPLMGTITGMAIRYASLGVVSVNRRLNDIWKPFALWHELAHVFRGHIDEDGFGMHQDRDLFTVTVDSHTISRQEKEANLISAEYNLDTDEILALIGYHNRTLQDYRELKKKQEEITQA